MHSADWAPQPAMQCMRATCACRCITNQCNHDAAHNGQSHQLPVPASVVTLLQPHMFVARRQHATTAVRASSFLQTAEQPSLPLAMQPDTAAPVHSQHSARC